MFSFYNHPAVQFVCRHCGKNAGYDPEMCFYCGPICGECFNDPNPCKGELRHRQRVEAERQAGQGKTKSRRK